MISSACNSYAYREKYKGNSSGSFIGVLNLTIERAPTNPRDNANDDLITAIIIVVPIAIKGKTLNNECDWRDF